MREGIMFGLRVLLKYFALLLAEPAVSVFYPPDAVLAAGAPQPVFFLAGSRF
jgi:hypothetical protein